MKTIQNANLVKLLKMAKEQYQMYVQTGEKRFQYKALAHYFKYKNLGGKREIDGLDLETGLKIVEQVKKELSIRHDLNIDFKGCENSVIWAVSISGIRQMAKEFAKEYKETGCVIMDVVTSKDLRRERSAK